MIIYTSPQTQGHQLYLYDKFMSTNQPDAQTQVDIDFDDDGQPGGVISGFIVPAQIPGEVNAGKITAFVGEGDTHRLGDWVKVNGTPLWDGTANNNSKGNPNNDFNSTSAGLNTYDGIDIDTLGIDPPNGQYITWSSDILKPGDTTAQIDLLASQDQWNLVYLILSFRSIVTTGGKLSYSVK